ncbi:ArsR/SmtB family transcription factor [Vibrio sp. SCSIO 43137]|uniref:ArsR/SmtB family transcription factor n=1 Tax=Vibrio sp. SCSIO 43137 TaxID=3021011 RepID=UPI00230790E0|nr:helix-turn-helix domain-containing protein [Vibrio sp. SCSIO 43137]WCE30344.1 helix-turn-helix domain-containing protein [Vibrio sp. SCSIO 43137]
MEPNIAYLANLIGDQARSKMLIALMGGKALTATELSVEADITPQTASSHLQKLVEGELLIVRKQGRHKYFQLKDGKIADLLEQLLNISSEMVTAQVSTGPSDKRLRRARICYDHLAGELGVALFDALISEGLIIDAGNDATLTEQGKSFFDELGYDFNQLKSSKHPLCKACLDWSERRSHLAGKLGSWILTDAIEQKWATQDLDSRAISFSQKGLTAFSRKYRIPASLL